MLSDNRGVIADILDGLADGNGHGDRLRDGAATLRWVAALEAEPDPDELAELGQMRDQLEAINEALIARDANGKTMTPFAFRKLVAAVLA